MTLFVTRHGQTDYNVDNLVCGISNAKLTESGRKQANELALKIKELKFDYLYVSPLQRAIDTATIATKYHQIEMIKEPRIQEINFGIYEGVSRDYPGFLENKMNLAFRYPNGESFVELCQRVYNFLDETKDLWTNKNVLLVCHGAVCRAINTYFNDMSNEDIFYYQTENCQLLTYK